MLGPRTSHCPTYFDVSGLILSPGSLRPFPLSSSDVHRFSRVSSKVLSITSGGIGGGSEGGMQWSCGVSSAQSSGVTIGDSGWPNEERSHSSARMPAWPWSRVDSDRSGRAERKESRTAETFRVGWSPSDNFESTRLDHRLSLTANTRSDGHANSREGRRTTSPATSPSSFNLDRFTRARV